MSLHLSSKNRDMQAGGGLSIYGTIFYMGLSRGVQNKRTDSHEPTVKMVS